MIIDSQASHTVPLAIVAQSDEPELRPLGFDLVLKAGDMVRRVQRFLNNYESEHQFASEEVIDIMGTVIIQ